MLGLLVIGRSPADWLPGAYTQFLRLAGNDLTAPITDEEVIDGTVADLIRRIDEKLEAHNLRGVRFADAAQEARSETYPMDALRQLVRNAFMHRSYEATNAPVRVYWFDDRIEMHNPGGPFGSVTPENFGQPGVVDYRNPDLAEALRALGYVQRFGAGIAIARKALGERLRFRGAAGLRRRHRRRGEAMISIAFFNNKGGVGKTSLVYHTAWMFAELGHRVLAVDLDPQSNLSIMALDEERLEALWPDDDTRRRCTGRWRRCSAARATSGRRTSSHAGKLGLLVGDLALSRIEDDRRPNGRAASKDASAPFV